MQSSDSVTQAHAEEPSLKDKGKISDATRVPQKQNNRYAGMVSESTSNPTDVSLEQVSTPRGKQYTSSSSSIQASLKQVRSTSESETYKP